MKLSQYRKKKNLKIWSDILNALFYIIKALIDKQKTH